MSELTVGSALHPAVRSGALSLGDLEAVRLILRGNSIIDWNRASFASIEDVDRFLGLHLLDMSDPEDQRRLRFVHGEAVNYLEEHLGLHFPEDMKDPADVRELFLIASQAGGFRRRQIQACVVLKLMHVINHMEAAELRFQMPLSEAEILDLAERRIVQTADRMRAEGFPLVAFYGSRKTRNSVITKLIAKKENTAATIFDKLRFRIVTEERSDILPAIAWLTRNLFPFNYVIPGQSHNNLLHLGQAIDELKLDHIAELLQGTGLEELEHERFNPEENPFSGDSYKMINFIVDFPVRVDHLGHGHFSHGGHADMGPGRYGALLGRTVFVLVEFQVIDRNTARANEEGENAHRLYKQRQRAIVEKRLKKGGRWKRVAVPRAR